MQWLAFIVTSLVMSSCNQSREATDDKVNDELDKPFFVNDPEGAETKKECDFPGIRTIGDMPKDHDNPEGRKFQYKFQYIEKFKGAPVVVFLPGGPGGDSMGKDSYNAVLKSAMNLVLIDPRGVGCNFINSKAFNLKELTTWQHAQDVIRVMRSLKVRKFFIYGISYGTVIGTVVAYEAERVKLPLQAVVLEGIVGKSFTNGNRQTFDVEYKRLISDYPFVKAAMTKRELPLGFSDKDWGEFISKMLYYSRYYAAGVIQSAMEASPGSEDYIEIQDLVKSVLKEEKNLGETTFFVSVACREIFDKENLIFELRNGEMQVAEDEFPELTKRCNALSPKNYFDPAKYQIRAPIYYFQGENDPATPLGQARNHYQTQTSSQSKIWIETRGGGHSPLLAEDQLFACAPLVWKRISLLDSVNGVLNNDGLCKALTPTDDRVPLSLTSPSIRKIDAERVKATIQ